MLTGITRRWFPWNWDIREGENSVGEVEFEQFFPVSRGHDKVVAWGAEYSVVRTSHSILLQGYTGTVAETEHPFLRSYVRLTYGEHELILQPTVLFGFRCVLADGEAEIGAVRLAGMRRIRADLPDDIPLEVRLFVLWLFLAQLGR